jgi:hypothetical protein
MDDSFTLHLPNVPFLNNSASVLLQLHRRHGGGGLNFNIQQTA